MGNYGDRVNTVLTVLACIVAANDRDGVCRSDYIKSVHIARTAGSTRWS